MTTLRLSRLLPLVLVVLAGCYTSRDPRVLTRDDHGVGSFSVLTMRSGARHTGELLAVTDSALYLLTGQRVAIARIPDVRMLSLDAEGDDEMVVRFAGNATAAEISRARRASRFPFGIPPAAMTALLGASGQSAPDPLGGGTP